MRAILLEGSPSLPSDRRRPTTLASSNGVGDPAKPRLGSASELITAERRRVRSNRRQRRLLRIRGGVDRAGPGLRADEPAVGNSSDGKIARVPGVI